MSLDRIAKGAGGAAIPFPTEPGRSLPGVGAIGLTEAIQPNIEMLANLMQRGVP